MSIDLVLSVLLGLVLGVFVSRVIYWPIDRLRSPALRLALYGVVVVAGLVGVLLLSA